MVVKFQLIILFIFCVSKAYSDQRIAKDLKNSSVDTIRPKKLTIDSNDQKEYYITDLPLDELVNSEKYNTNEFLNPLTNPLFKKNNKNNKKPKSTKPTNPLPILDTSKYNDFFLVPVYFATDRAKNDNSLENYYKNGRSLTESLEYGLVHISLPNSHRVGNLELPSMLKVKTSYEPDKYVLIRSIQVIGKDKFYNSISSTMSTYTDKDIFVFIHGYNSTFSEGAKRAAQLCYDLGFKGLSLYYSWASNGNASDYIKDGTNAEYSFYAFKNYIQSVIQKVKPNKIHIVAHSMGNRVLALALKSLAEENTKIKFNQIILAAPDIDAAIFERDIAPKIKNLAQRYTIYTAKDDKALNVSEILNGYVRLGKINKRIDGFSTIDASYVLKDDLFNHSYFVSSKDVINDIRILFTRNDPPEERNLIKNTGYWSFRR